MKKIVTILVGCLSCSSVLGSLPLDPSAPQVSQRTATITAPKTVSSSGAVVNIEILNQLAGQATSSEERKRVLDLIELGLKDQIEARKCAEQQQIEREQAIKRYAELEAEMRKIKSRRKTISSKYWHESKAGTMGIWHKPPESEQEESRVLLEKYNQYRQEMRELSMKFGWDMLDD